MKIFILSIIALISLAIFVLGANSKHTYLEIKSPTFMPKLTHEDILVTAETGEYEELLIAGGFSAGGLFGTWCKIYGDGTAVLSETLYSKEDIDKLEDYYYTVTGGHPLPQEYINLRESFGEQEYYRNYIAKLSKEDILPLVADLGQLPFRERKTYEAGFGVGFYIDLYIDGKAQEFKGRRDSINEEDLNVEILDWLEKRLIPLLKEKGELTDMPRSDLLDYIPEELVGKYSFIEVKED
jgi:hypothetical protein